MQASIQSVKQKTCPVCSKRFRTKLLAKVYCTVKCQRRTATVKTRVDPAVKAANSAFARQIGSECIRAMTYEVLGEPTFESMCALYEVYTLRMKFCGYSASSDYELSHIAPVKGLQRLGLYCADNLVVAPKAMNRRHGTRHFGEGRSINRQNLNPKYAIDPYNTTVSQAAKQAIKYIGTDLFLSVVKACKIQPTQRFKLLNWITGKYDPSNPVHVAALPSLGKLYDLATKELQHVKSAISGKDVGEYNEYEPVIVELVMLRELQRMSQYRPELEVYAYALGEALVTQSEAKLFTEHHAQIIFDVLHGKPLAVMKDSLEMLIAENTQHLYVTYEHNPDGAIRYDPKTLLSYYAQGGARGGARAHVTTLAEWKAALLRSAPAAPAAPATSWLDDLASVPGPVVSIPMNTGFDCAPF